jgi:hypothetical protein
MKYFVLVFSFCCMLFSHTSFGQLVPKDSLAKNYLAIAKKKMAEKKYAEANDIFKKIFSFRSAMPDELAYYYGYNLLNLNKYTQSRAALNKYLVLQGDNGPLSQKAKEALLEIDCKETGYHDVTIECDVCYGDSTTEIACRNCKGRGTEICPLCKGNAVVMTPTNFGINYHTCHRCAGEKIVKCTVCKGTLKEKIICYNCNGRGRKKIRRKC